MALNQPRLDTLDLSSHVFATCKFAYQQVTTVDTQVICDTSTNSPRPFGPMSHHRVVFDTLHPLAHPGPKSTVKLISGIFFWSYMTCDITSWTCSCVSCTNIHAPLGTFSTPDTLFGHVHIDLVAPWPLSQGCTCLQTCTDRFTSA